MKFMNLLQVSNYFKYQKVLQSLQFRNNVYHYINKYNSSATLLIFMNYCQKTKQDSQRAVHVEKQLFYNVH